MGHGFSMIYSKQGYGGYVINTMIYVPLLLDFVFTSDLKIFWKLNFEKHARKKNVISTVSSHWESQLKSHWQRKLYENI